MALDKVRGDWDILITGQDASIGGLQNILDGKQSMTVYKPIKKLATLTAECAVKLSKGEELDNINGSINNGKKDIPALLLETIVVDTNNIRETVIADKFVNESQLAFQKD